MSEWHIGSEGFTIQTPPVDLTPLDAGDTVTVPPQQLRRLAHLIRLAVASTILVDMLPVTGGDLHILRLSGSIRLDWEHRATVEEYNWKDYLDDRWTPPVVFLTIAVATALADLMDALAETAR